MAGPPAASTGWGRFTTGGADVLPGYFATSYSPNPCKRSQTIDLIATGATAAELDAAPDLKVEEYISCYAGNGTTPDNFYIKVELRGAAQEVLASFNVGADTARVTAPSGWTKYEHVFSDYGPGVRYVYFEDGGWDGGFWAGQYGSYHDGAKVYYSEDTDGDGIPDADEDFYAFLDKDNPDDALEDGDGDGYANIDEYLAGLDMGDTDTDDDNATDGEEFNDLGTNPLIADTDGDGLLDGDEVNAHGSDPLLTDTDGDFFQDGDEVAKGSLPTSSTSTPGGIVITSQPGLLGSDLTDPANDGVGTTGTGSGFDWSVITTSGTASFTGEGAYSVFDNLAPGGSGSKWCCPTLPTAAGFHHITVGFNTTANTDILTSLDYFTVTSANDAPDRQPRIWEIQGSMNGTTFETIVRFDSPKSFWKLDNQTLRFDLPKGSLPYRYLRFAVFAINAGSQFQIDEIEYFGEQTNADADGDGIPKLVEDYYDFLDDSVAADGAAAQDGDGLSNAGEWAAGSKMLVTDTDGDGLTDGEDVAAGASPILADTDTDGLSDFAEVNTHGTNPALADTDGDFFSDGAELAAGTSPTLASSTPGGITVALQSGLLGNDLTDTANDGAGTTGTGTGFDWSVITTSGTASFTNEGAYSVFDNLAPGSTGSKWCCPTLPTTAGFHHITVGFNTVANTDVLTSLDYFTVTSGGDAPERQPRIWEIQGSLNGTTFETIARFESAKSIWTANSQTLRFDLPKGSLPYRYLRFAVFAVNSGTQFQIDEIEFFGEQTNADADGDGIPKLYEDYHAFLSDSNPDDAAGDQDGDGLDNLGEYDMRTNPSLADTDGDELSDGDEITAGANPLVTDSDADGLTDGAEVNTHETDPTLVDTDSDNFSDGYEITQSSDPVSASSTPAGVVAEGLGFGAGALLTSDFTDRENNINDATAAGTGFDWVSSAATNKPDFRTGEGALNVFDNKVAGGEAKWCCDPPSVSIPAQSVTVQMPYPIALTHFTMASSEDAPERDPRKWSIQGSNDGTTFTNIFVQDDAVMSFWGTNRLYVMKFTLAAPAPTYKWFRYSVTATNSTMHSISEIEYFGIDQDTDGDGMPDYWEAKYPAVLDIAVADAAGDPDSDGLTNLQEFQNGTTPGDTDSDDDGFNDGSEISGGSDPLGPRVLSFSKTGSTFTLTMKVYDVGKKYKLRRSSTLNNDFVDIGNVFSPATDTQVITDTAAPAGKAFYLIERVP